MNFPDHSDLERRLARLRPADLPNEFSRRLHAAEPLPPPAVNFGWRPPGAVGSLRVATALLLRPWPLAYAGLLAAWLLIFSLRFATPAPPAGVAYSPAVTRFPSDPDSLPASLGSLSLDRTTLLTRNSLTDPWP